MILYKYTADCSKLNLEQEGTTKKGYEGLYPRRSDIAEWNSKFYTAYRTEKKFFIMISDIRKDKMTIVAELEMEVDPRECVDYIRKILPEMELLACEEITSDEFYKEMVRTERNNWTECYLRSMKEDLKLDTEPEHSYYEPVAYQVSERIYTSQDMNRQKQSEQMQEIMASESFYEEMERIYALENEKRFVGHPVHYLITAGDKAAADDMIDILIPALLENQRLLSGRAYDVQKMTHKAEQEGNFENIFSGAKGGTVILSLEGEKSTGMYATGNYDLAKALGNKLNEYGNSTLFIFVDISGNRSVSDDTIAEILSNADLIQIQEGQGDLKRASAYLKRLAEKTEYHDYTIDELTQYLPKEKKLYSVSDIYNAYNRWYGRGLKTHIYKAYKEKDLVKIELKKKTDKPYLELQKMVGLSEVKKVTDEILAAAKMQKMRKQMGLPWVQSSMHMLFSGNPGTAKTTVARLLSQVLKEEEVLKYGHIVECGRQDLVGKYVGWTAQIVESKFQAARGGILFIDEAYSLVEDNRTYGAEAINTIVQEMENYRDEVIVIFAGYPEKMKEFLEQNEGLASRIAFHLNFPDYSPEELTQILDLMLEKSEYRMDERTREKCFSICADACREENYGNGRFVRNLLDHAIMRQADRLIREHQNGTLGKEEACLLTADDFEMIGLEKETAEPADRILCRVNSIKNQQKKLNQRLSAENESM